MKYNAPGQQTDSSVFPKSRSTDPSRMRLFSVSADVRKVLNAMARADLAAEAAARPVKRSKSQDERDKWLYDQCLKLVVYTTILIRAKKKPKSWDCPETVQGIKDAAIAYAKRNGLDPIPRRSKGRRGRRT